MTLHFEPVCPENRKEIEKLKLYPEQTGFIESVAECMAEAGYGKAAVHALLERLHHEYDCKKVYLSVYEENLTAIALYKQIGFYFNGACDTKGEKIMVYDFES